MHTITVVISIIVIIHGSFTTADYCIRSVTTTSINTALAGFVEQKPLELSDLVHLALYILDIRCVRALQSGQLHSVNDLERFLVGLHRVLIRIGQIVYVLIEKG